MVASRIASTMALDRAWRGFLLAFVFTARILVHPPGNANCERESTFAYCLHRATPHPVKLTKVQQVRGDTMTAQGSAATSKLVRPVAVSSVERVQDTARWVAMARAL